MYEICHGKIPNGLFVMHTCDVRLCINPAHLLVGTRSDNQRDAALKNRFVHKLTFEQIREIRHLYVEGFKQTQLAIMFGIGQQSVSRIVNRKQRPHVL